MELGGELERLGPVLRLADDLEPVALEQRPSGRAEARVVVDDENGLRHARIVAEHGSRGYTGTRTIGRACELLVAQERRDVEQLARRLVVRRAERRRASGPSPAGRLARHAAGGGGAAAPKPVAITVTRTSSPFALVDHGAEDHVGVLVGGGR